MRGHRSRPARLHAEPSCRHASTVRRPPPTTGRPAPGDAAGGPARAQRGARRCCMSTLRACTRASCPSSAARTSARFSASSRCCATRVPLNALSSFLAAAHAPVGPPRGRAQAGLPTVRRPAEHSLPSARQLQGGRGLPTHRCGRRHSAWAGRAAGAAHLNCCSVPSSAPNMRRLRFFTAGLASSSSRGRLAVPGASGAAWRAAPPAQPALRRHGPGLACRALLLSREGPTCCCRHGPALARVSVQVGTACSDALHPSASGCTRSGTSTGAAHKCPAPDSRTTLLPYGALHIAGRGRRGAAHRRRGRDLLPVHDHRG